MNSYAPRIWKCYDISDKTVTMHSCHCHLFLQGELSDEDAVVSLCLCLVHHCRSASRGRHTALIGNFIWKSIV